SAACQLLGADLGRVILYGAAISLPMAVVSGILYGGWISKRIFLPVPAIAIDRQAELPGEQKNPPPVPLVVLILLLPVLLIFASTIWGGPVLGFLGHPF